jgi:hypothetical protein
MERACGFDPRARGVSRRLLRGVHEPAADPVAPVGLGDHEGRDPAPGPIVVRHRHEEVRGGPDERAVVVCNEHVGAWIGQHAFEPTAERVCGLRMAQLIEQASELFGILNPSRANRHRTHLSRGHT